jgi:hypothetical protein
MKRAPRTPMMRALLVVVLFAGVAHAEAEKTKQRVTGADKAPQTMDAGETTKWLTFFDKLVETVVRSSSATCTKMAGDVNAVIDANRDAVAIARAAHAAGRKLPQAAQQHMLEGVKKMVPAMQKCGQDDKVRAAFAKLDLTRKDTAARR